VTDVDAAWAELDAANLSLGWTVSRPSLHDDVRGTERWAVGFRFA
jgi:hypothetical protein